MRTWKSIKSVVLLTVKLSILRTFQVIGSLGYWRSYSRQIGLAKRNSENSTNTLTEIPDRILIHKTNPLQYFTQPEKRQLISLEEKLKQAFPETKQDCLQNYSFFDFQLKTDFYGDEVSWSLVSETTGNVFQSMEPGSSLNNHQYSFKLCVPASEECLIFTIQDQRGDGICCNYGSGSYSVKLDDNILASSDGDRFKSMDVIEFGYCKYPIFDTNHTGQNTTHVDKCSPDQLSVKIVLATGNIANNTFFEISNVGSGKIEMDQDVFEKNKTYEFDSCFAADECYNFTIMDDGGNHTFSVDDQVVSLHRSLESRLFGNCNPSTLAPTPTPPTEPNNTVAILVEPFHITLKFSKKDKEYLDQNELLVVETVSDRFLYTRLSRAYPDTFIEIDLNAGMRKADRRFLQDSIDVELTLSGEAYFLDQSAPLDSDLRESIKVAFTDHENEFRDLLIETGQGDFVFLILTTSEFPDETRSGSSSPPSQAIPPNLDGKLPAIGYVAIAVSFSAFIALVIAFAVCRRRANCSTFGLHAIKPLGTTSPTFSLGSSKSYPPVVIENAPSDVALCEMEPGESPKSDGSSVEIDDMTELDRRIEYEIRIQELKKHQTWLSQEAIQLQASVDADYNDLAPNRDVFKREDFDSWSQEGESGGTMLI